MRFIVIGITDSPNPWFPPEVLEKIRRGHVFSGGKRHRELVSHLLPKDYMWIDITAPLQSVFERYRNVQCSARPKGTLSQSEATERMFNVQSPIVVFASGDPLFFGFANTLRRELPEAEMEVYPTFNSLQMLAHRLLMPYHDLHIVSLTGRPWQAFDQALIEGHRKIGVLTDKEHTPATIAQRMLEYNYNNYKIHIGEHLGNPQKERVTTHSLEETTQRDFEQPNCIILEVPKNTSILPLGPQGRLPEQESFNSLILRFGIPDSEFALLNGREKMITKMPIRLLTLQALDLPQKHTLWDIGACTGSISIEARRLFPHLHIVAFEIRPECEDIIKENARRHGAPGIEVVIGDFLNVPLEPCSLATEGTQESSILQSFNSSILPSSPDAIFIGGHGGRLKEIMAKALTYLSPEGCIVMNSVKGANVPNDSKRLFDEACEELGLRQEPPMYIQIDNYHPINILKCRR